MVNEAIERFTPMLEEALSTKTRDEWLALFADADVPAQPVLTREEFLVSSAVAANDMDLAVAHPELGEVRMMGLPVTVEAAVGSVSRPAPLLGQHTDEVVAEWSAVAEARAAASAGPAADADPSPATLGQADSNASQERPLAGLRVIDLASFIAGPVVSRHLGMLGADVIKVEPPAGDSFRAIGALFHSWNHGKRSIVLDLTTDEGRADLHRLVASADVVIENFRPGVSARLGCDQETLRAVNPDLVFLSSPGYGLDETIAHQPAFDPLVQAIGGFMAAQGGMSSSDDGVEPVFLTVPIHDVMTPMIGAFGVVAGLWQRALTGSDTGSQADRFQTVRTSLVQSTMAAQAAEFTRYVGRPAPELGGFDHAGTETNTWHEDGDGFRWQDGELSVPVEMHGLTASALAAANDLTMMEPTEQFGPMQVFGQLIGGAGPHPAPAPTLDQHGEEIRAELDRLDPPTR
jgi:crotonobetainyl-CoA:carnitine CoA-transferase CaiB-like acyl-CoA transferase